MLQSPLQLTKIQGSGVNLTYNYVAGSDNGKISSVQNGVSGETVTYLYDSLNRLSSASGSGWGNSYVFDGFGNLLQKNLTSGSAPTLTQTVNAANNHINGRSYDANGNDVTGSGVTYDFLNRMTVYWGSSSESEYGYDASNRRIYKYTYNHNPTGEYYYLYGLDGENLATYTVTRTNSPASITLTLATSRTYFFGKKLWTTEDNVGTAATGGTFWPWGEQRTGSSSEQYGFATYWQDSESSLNYAHNRYYSSTVGRFLSPDPYQNSAGPNVPQSWNRYSYVLSDPINHFDPTGLDCADTNPIGPLTMGSPDCPTGPGGTGFDPGALGFDSWTTLPTGLSNQGGINVVDQAGVDEGAYANGVDSEFIDQYCSGTDVAGCVDALTGLLQSGQCDCTIPPLSQVDWGQVWADITGAIGKLLQPIAMRYYTWTVTCYIHPLGGANHEADDRRTVEVSAPDAQTAEFIGKLQIVAYANARYGVGKYHLQHCNVRGGPR